MPRNIKMSHEERRRVCTAVLKSWWSHKKVKYPGWSTVFFSLRGQKFNLLRSCPRCWNDGNGAKNRRNPQGTRVKKDTVTLEPSLKMRKYSDFILLHILRRSPEANLQCFPPDLVSFHNKSTAERIRVINHSTQEYLTKITQLIYLWFTATLSVILSNLVVVSI